MDNHTQYLGFAGVDLAKNRTDAPEIEQQTTI